MGNRTSTFMTLGLVAVGGFAAYQAWSTLEGGFTSVETGIVGTLSNAISSVLGGTRSIFQNAVGSVESFVNSGIAGIAGDFRSASDWVGRRMSSAVSNITSDVRALESGVSSAVTSAGDFFSSTASGIGRELRSGIGEARSAIGSVADTLGSTIRTAGQVEQRLIGGLISEASSAGSLIANSVSHAENAAANAAATIANRTAGFAGRIGSAAVSDANALRRMAGGIVEAGQKQVTKDIAYGNRLANQLEHTIQSSYDRVSAFDAQALHSARQGGALAVNALSNTEQAAVHDMQRAVAAAGTVANAGTRFGHGVANYMDHELSHVTGSVTHAVQKDIPHFAARTARSAEHAVEGFGHKVESAISSWF